MHTSFYWPYSPFFRTPFDAIHTSAAEKQGEDPKGHGGDSCGEDHPVTAGQARFKGCLVWLIGVVVHGHFGADGVFFGVAGGEFR